LSLPLGALVALQTTSSPQLYTLSLHDALPILARSNICWVSNARFPTSSRKSVPPSASWKYPFLALSAPVNAPLTCPKKADGASSDRKSTRLNSSHVSISYAVFCLKKKKQHPTA